MSNNCVRVLLVEDNPGDAELIRVALRTAKTEFDVYSSVDMAGALTQLAESDFDVVLADLRLPDCSGLDVIATIRRCRSDVSIVVLTGMDSDEVALDSLDQGAQDYLVKDRMTSDVLERAIRYAIGRQQNAVMRRLLAQVKASEKLLEKKNDRLEKLYETAHRFVDNVSHEFRTPLTVIKEYVSLMRDGVVGCIDEEQSKILDTVADRADDLNIMVDDMLDVSKLEAGLLGAWRKNARIADIIEHVRPSLEKKALVKGVQLDIDIDDHLADVYCDPEKVGRVVINLTINAIKFSGDPGHVRLWAEQDEAAHEVTVAISDDGPGISSDYLAAIFERFKQLESNPHSSTKGFGLGLNIAKELVDLNFGQMNVESQVGQGSTFSFTVPIAEPIEVMRRYLERTQHMRNGSGEVSLLVGTIDESFDAMVADEVDVFLNYLLRHNDLLFRAGMHHWLLVLPELECELDKFIARAVSARRDTNRNRPHGPIPEIEISTEGTWNVREQSTELLAALTSHLRTPERIDA